MEISPRKLSKRMPEPVDEWLHNEGFFRKHAPRDPTCLFRAISEQVYLTQHFHIRVRQECVKYMRENKEVFEESVSIPFESYLEQMSCFTEWGGMLEIEAMSLLYQRDIIIFSGQKLTHQSATNNGFEKTIYLCHTPQKQYESVYAKDFIATAAYCQSLVYQMLYTDVFKMANVDSTVHKMLHDRSNNLRHDKFFLKENIEIRDELTIELLKPEDGSEDNEDTQALARGITPFPYRIAKALDPNIYRNTDFDIWHEIRREVRNAGWMRYNGSELQVGGKCLVQMDVKDDLDVANNNNSAYTSCDKDSNGNDQKTTQKSVKRDPKVYSGHIQEMSKNEGPVVVFIEDIGEKKTVPFSALKPISSRKTKQPNWTLATCKKNAIFDSNQRWKKSWSGNSRKIKDLAMNLNTLTSTNIDKNNNNKSEEQWDNESGHSEETQSTMAFQTYAMERFTSYQGYAVNTSIDVLPVSVVLENPQVAMVESLKQEISQSPENSAPVPPKNTDKLNVPNDAAEKQLPSSPAPTICSEPAQQGPQNCNRNPQNEVYYPPQPGISQYYAGNTNMYYAAPEGHIYPPPQYFIGNNTSYSSSSGDPSIPVNQVNQVLQAINFSAPKSVEANGSDLPLTDMITLRFFYNLGLEYFRASYNWAGCATGQAIPFGPCYMPPVQYNNSTTSTLSVTESPPQNDEEIAQISQSIQQNLGISQRKGEYTSTKRDFLQNNGRGQGKMLSPNPSGAQKLLIGKNESQNTPEHKASPHAACVQDSSPYSPGHEKQKEQGTPNRENQRSNRNSLAPRFKKNFDGRHRNSRQPQQQPFQYQQNAVNIDLHNTKNAGPYNHHNSCGQPATPPVQHVNASNPPVYQNPPNHVPYAQQPVYTTMPYYPTEAEPPFQNNYYSSNPGFPVPYIPHSDITDGNNVNHYPPSVYPGMENYAQPYPVYPQYVYQQSIYPTIPPQNAQENWYALPAQPHVMATPQHYIQYTQNQPSMPSSPNGPQHSNVSK